MPPTICSRHMASNSSMFGGHCRFAGTFEDADFSMKTNMKKVPIFIEARKCEGRFLFYKE